MGTSRAVLLYRHAIKCDRCKRVERIDQPEEVMDWWAWMKEHGWAERAGDQRDRRTDHALTGRELRGPQPGVGGTG